MSSALALDPADFTAQFDAAAGAAGFAAEPYGTIEGLPLRAWTRRTPGPRPRVYFSTGMHGDEPAPPWALLRLVRDGFFDARCTWFLCPLLNPTGFLQGKRESFAGIDLNRDYKDKRSAEVRGHIAWLQRQPNFDLVICLHEDWEATGFYLYELNPGNRASLASVMIAAARSFGPIESATTIDGRAVTETGIIRPVGDPLLRELWPEAIYLHLHHATLVYTVETASGAPLGQRVATHCAVLKAAIDGLLKRSDFV